MRVIKLRLENLKVINKHSFKNLTYIQREIDTQEGLELIKSWWPHCQWLKSNKLPTKEFPQHQHFVKHSRKLRVKRRILDAHAVQQALEIAEDITDQQVGQVRLENAKIK